MNTYNNSIICLASQSRLIAQIKVPVFEFYERSLIWEFLAEIKPDREHGKQLFPKLDSPAKV
jgi:hypothetical protein